jgi:hypothetical protein
MYVKQSVQLHEVKWMISSSDNQVFWLANPLIHDQAKK